MADIIRYEYEGEFKVLVSENDLQDFLNNNTVVSYNVYDGVSIVNDSETIDDSDLDIVEEE